MTQNFTTVSLSSITAIVISLISISPDVYQAKKAISPEYYSIRDTAGLASKEPKLTFKQGPPIELKWDNGPISLGMVMDMSLVRASGKTSQDLMISRIWDGLHIFQSNSFSSKDLFKPSQLVGKAGILLFQPLDWNKDGVTDLIASNRDGFLYFMPGTGVFPNTKYEESQVEVLRDPASGLPFNVPYENPNYPKQDDLGGYIDAQYYNYTYPKIYTSSAFKQRDLVIGDWGGNLWWLPDLSDGSERPLYKGIKYSKEKSIHRAGSQYQKDLGLHYVKPAEKIADESGQPFLLGTGKAEELIFKGANTRPIVYPDESGNPGLLIVAGSFNQQFFFLKRINPLSERKPVFRNMGEIHIAGLDKSRLNFHAILTLFENKGRKDLLLATDNYLAAIENSGWERGLPRLTFRNWMSGPDATGSFYAFNDMLTDSQGKRYIVHFGGKSWNFIPLDKTPDGLRLRYTDSLQLMDQNGVFRVEGETDPQLAPEWGYHRITRWDFDKSGRNHLIAGTDKGLFYLLKDDPATAKPGKFIYHSSGPLKDSAGNTIRIHNRAVAASLDLDEDGLEDLLVGGISYQLGIKSDPTPGGGIYYMINRGNNAEGLPILSPPKLLELGPDFKPRINSHVSLQVLDLDKEKEKEIIIGLQNPGWDGRIYRKVKGKIAFHYTGSEIMAKPIKDQVLDIDGDGKYDIVRPGGETGVGYYRTLEKK